jgi:hypothetical protein
MKNIIQIIHVEKRAGRSKAGNDYDMRMGQCIVERLDEEGNSAPLVGILMLPEKFKETVPGRYEVTFELAVGQDARIGSVVADMKLLPREARPAAQPPAPPREQAKA